MVMSLFVQIRLGGGNMCSSSIFLWGVWTSVGGRPDASLC